METMNLVVQVVQTQGKELERSEEGEMVNDTGDSG
jgi:hypothetical protein